MINKLLSSNTKRMLVKIGKAIEKGACVDIQDYLNDNNTTTRNAVCFVRIDKINTNLSHIIDPETAIIKVFKRSSWEGVVVIDDESKSIFSIFTEKTIRRVPKNKTRKKPHYSQTFLNTLNKEEIAPIKQTTLVGFESLPEAKFSVDEYEEDFFSIMNETTKLYSGYRYWVISYEVKNMNLTTLNAVLMDSDFDVVENISILELLKPDFKDLTSTEIIKGEEKDAHMLVSIKPGLRGHKSSEPEKQTEIYPKAVEESKKA